MRAAPRAAPQRGSGKRSTMPTYVCRPEGVVAVPPMYVARDKGRAVRISAEKWRSASRDHASFSASFLAKLKCTISKDCIVCLKNDNMCLWFLRFEVSGGSSAFEHGFGYDFLWQLGFPTCMSLLADMRINYRLAKAPAHVLSRLVGSLTPTYQDFHRVDWPACELVHEFNCYYDKSFVMSVKPCYGPYPSRTEARLQVQAVLNRPCFLKGRSCALDRLPSDMATHIVSLCASDLAASPLKEHRSSLLALRLVCKDFKKTADAAATALVASLLKQAKAAFESGAMVDLVAARDAVLRSGIVFLQLLCEADASMLVWMRLRSGKPPNELPFPRRGIKRARCRSSGRRPLGGESP